MGEPSTAERIDDGIAVDRRGFLQLASLTAAAFLLPGELVPALAKALARQPRPSVVWLSFQECTGCTESLTRAFAPTIEDLIFDHLSLDYHHTLQAASGEAAEAARRQAARRGDYILVVDGAVPLAAGGSFSTIGGLSNLALLQEMVPGAQLVLALGSCAVDGGIAAAAPNPTGASGIGALMAAGRIATRPLVNLPGCPPLPDAISGTLAFFLVFDRLPPLDASLRPLAFYSHTVHEQCDRYHHFLAGRFAATFDDAGARDGWCLLKLGCRGPVTRNACARFKWNGGVSFPVQSGHPCLGCSEPGFWDQGSFYTALPEERLAVAASDAASNAGEQLYADNCVFCHSADPAQFQQTPEAIVDLLKADKVRAHRRFRFSDAELAELKVYLQQKGAHQ